MYDHRGFLTCLAACLSVSIALACGPEFPWQLLDNRTDTLKATPANSFAFEAVHLAPQPTDSLKAVEGSLFMAEDVETDGLSIEQSMMIPQMRTADTGDEAFAKGAGVPLAIRFYTAGAVAFRHEDVLRATAWFQAVLQLPENDQWTRATWAMYMLGRSYGRLGDIEKASEAFMRTRDLAIKGAPDPLGLAVASYGEEARLHLDLASSYLTGDESSAESTTGYAREIAAAVALYAEQAARGSLRGIQSLRLVAERLLLRPSVQLAMIVADPTIQRLLVAHVLARDNNIPERFSYGPEADEYESDVQRKPLLAALVDAIKQRGLDHPAGADRLAVLAYRSGWYDLAAHLTANTPGPLASWVKAKLALQNGDLAAAAAFYADASKAFPSSDEVPPLDSENVRLLAGESGVLLLARGEYVEALTQLYPVASTYWGDVAHLADRVLTVEELQHFVDAKVPPPETPHSGQETVEGTILSEEGALWLAPHSATQLRDLLARRLVREGRYQEALAYFHASSDTNFTDPDVRTHVTAYAQALREAEASWWPINRAHAWYKAAVLARKFGMEMMGYEAAPDFFAIGGSYGFGLGQSMVDGPLVTDGERQRFLASAANLDLRFHYRYLAVKYSNRAADLLPPRSQAFAAVLCQATGWMLSTPGAEQRVQDLYRRYVQYGPYVAWAAHFGHNCPAPDFDAAAHLARVQPFQTAHHFARCYRWLIGVGFMVVSGAVLARLVRRSEERAIIRQLTLRYSYD